MTAQRLQIPLAISSVTGEKHDCMLDYTLGSPVEMAISCAALGTHTVTANDLFDALCLIRLEAEKRGYVALCNGARKDAYPSPMSRQMGKGARVYIFRQGVQARLEDLVDLFSLATLDQVTTVSEQLRNYEAWLDSLG